MFLFLTGKGKKVHHEPEESAPPVQVEIIGPDGQVVKRLTFTGVDFDYGDRHISGYLVGDGDRETSIIGLGGSFFAVIR